MTTFLRLLNSENKADDLASACDRLRSGEYEPCHFEIEPDLFDAIPGKPFAYWISESVRDLFKVKGQIHFQFKQGIATADDFRFLKSWWEVFMLNDKYLPIAKGGPYSPWYQDLDLVVQWSNDGEQIRSFSKSRPQNIQHFRKPGITWPFRTQKGLNTRVLPANSAFTIQGMAAFHHEISKDDTLILLAITNSTPFKQLLLISVGFFAFQTGAMAAVPLPNISQQSRLRLIELAKRAWTIKHQLDSTDEPSHAFFLPRVLASRAGMFDPPALAMELERLSGKVDDLVFELYGLSDSEKTEIMQIEVVGEEAADAADADCDRGSDDELADDSVDEIAATLSWAAGVAFGRFDWRLATGEREKPAEPEPFDALPERSPGMLPDNVLPFHNYAGILIDDQGHHHDLTHLVEEVLGRVEIPVPDDVRRWLQRDFFVFHLQRYSKSRRKAPIYWPLSTSSGNYTLWLYYPSLSSQTLYKAINDFVEPKIKQVADSLVDIRNKGNSRSGDDEKQFEILQVFELELIELRDTLLNIAQNYKPNHDDGVQITAAPLWALFRYKPWQKVLKETWVKLEKGDYDWAHLAMSYWPERVREKCKTDKSLAIAHDLEALYVEPEAKPKKIRVNKSAGVIE